MEAYFSLERRLGKGEKGGASIEEGRGIIAKKTSGQHAGRGFSTRHEGNRRNGALLFVNAQTNRSQK